MTDQAASTLANSQLSEFYLGNMPTDRAGAPTGNVGST